MLAERAGAERAWQGDRVSESGHGYLMAIQQCWEQHLALFDMGAMAEGGDERRGMALPIGMLTFLLTDIEGSTPLCGHAHDTGRGGIRRGLG
jgi:hypothetical protein